MWIEHDGKGMPVSPDTKVIVRFRDGVEETPELAAPAIDWGNGDEFSNWNHRDPTGSDIVAYRVIE